MTMISEIEEMLMDAARDNDLATVKELLAQGVNINPATSNGRSPLHWAAENGNMEICKLLIDAGADINAKMNDKDTPLCLATKYGRADVAELLLAHGATPAPQPAPADEEMIDMDDVRELRNMLCAISSGYNNMYDWLSDAIVPEDELTEDWEYEVNHDVMDSDNPLAYYITCSTDVIYADDMREINAKMEDAKDRARELDAYANDAIERLDAMVASGNVDVDELRRMEDWKDDNIRTANDEDIEWVGYFIGASTHL